MPYDVPRPRGSSLVHQADLFYAMQLLFEDRLGIDVYTPVGQEWFDEGYWQFGAEHLGRALADQFLGLDAKWTRHADHRCSFDPAHPRRLILGVTLDQFRAMGHWSYVVATVQDNQEGFRRLADETGARYVYQVGNTRQQVRWDLDPLALVSSEVPIVGRGVRIHQPFDHETTFRYRPPKDKEDAQRRKGVTSTPSTKSPSIAVGRVDRLRIISSFVNCFPRIEPSDGYDCYRDFEAIRAYLPEFTFGVYGIDGPDGNLHPVEAIADAMAASGFAWHDKITGDGFGHVLHNWAAVGRPLIGHASHYRGQLGEHLWQDGVTCIDLDGRSPEGAADAICAIAADPDRHRAMCVAIRAEFDRIDWRGEVAAVMGLLA